MLELCIVDVWIDLLEKVAKAPGHLFAIRSFDVAVVPALWLWQSIGNGSPETGLLGDVHSCHRCSPSASASSATDLCSSLRCECISNRGSHGAWLAAFVSPWST